MLVYCFTFILHLTLPTEVIYGDLVKSEKQTYADISLHINSGKLSDETICPGEITCLFSYIILDI